MNIPNKKSSVIADKAWNLLRLALLWARKVDVFKRGINAKGFGVKAPSDHIRYLERQLSFDRTPDFHVKKDRLTGSIRFLFPCVGAKPVEFDYDVAAEEDGGFDYDFGVDDDGGVHGNHSGKENYLSEKEENECSGFEKKSELEEEGIDSRAEKFIAEFYGKIRFQN
ncbi:hypothetical protein REPUB_Repub10bG0102800 [Reevesia pubescens]